jgi:uncharacterized protein (TIGR03382 family)
MKKAFALLALCGLAGVASATTYNDAQNELFDNSFGHLDITSVDVTHDATNITFTINVRSSLDDTAWGKYCIGIDTGAAGGSPNNGWGRNVSWGGGGIDWYLGTWADDGGNNFGGELRSVAGFAPAMPDYATWLGNFPGTGSSTGTQQVITVSRAALGLTGDGTFCFDVFTTGGGGSDPGVDHLSRSDMATPGWGDQSTSGTFLCYTIPAPGAAALLGLGGLVMARRRRA